jgi:hypothetical protein
LNIKHRTASPHRAGISWNPWFWRPERLKKYCGNLGRGFFAFWRGFSEGTGLKNPETEPKRCQNQKRPLLLSILPNGCNIFENALSLRSALLPTFLFLALSNLSAEAQVSREYQLKAVFLYNFAQFTDWPENAFADTNAPIVIGIFGPDPFGPALPETIKGETVRGHPLAIQHYRRAEEIKTCHILFISESEARHTNELVKSLKGKPILTVADTDGPSTTEVAIRFVLENNKVHFRINQGSAVAANLVLSSKLLRVAEAPSPGRAP